MGSLRLEQRAEKAEADQKEVSDAYLRVRALLNAYDTAHGGTDRFEVTERHIKEIQAERDRLREALTKTVAALDYLIPLLQEDNRTGHQVVFNLNLPCLAREFARAALEAR